MNISIIGYGKMGKAVEKIALEKGYKIVQIIEVGEDYKYNSQEFLSSDVAIEFSEPESALNNIQTCLNAGIRIVSGTTGFDYNNDRFQKICLNKKTALFYAPNFSLGVNIFFELNKKLADLLNPFSDYNANIEETHHIHKLDKPSGTSIIIANDIINKNIKYNKWENYCTDKTDILCIKSHREGEVIGQHIVKWENEIDYIKIEHTAKNRKGFTKGAIIAAEFIKNKIGVFTMKDLINI